MALDEKVRELLQWLPMGRTRHLQHQRAFHLNQESTYFRDTSWGWGLKHQNNDLMRGWSVDKEHSLTIKYFYLCCEVSRKNWEKKVLLVFEIKRRNVKFVNIKRREVKVFDIKRKAVKVFDTKRKLWKWKFLCLIRGKLWKWKFSISWGEMWKRSSKNILSGLRSSQSRRTFSRTFSSPLSFILTWCSRSISRATRTLIPALVTIFFLQI